MAHQSELRTRDEDLLAPRPSGRDTAGVLNDLNDQLTVICAYASRGGDASYDAELTENYFALIESAGKRAAEIAGQLVVLDSARSSEAKPTKAVAWITVPHPIDVRTAPRPSSFRRRLGLA